MSRPPTLNDRASGLLMHLTSLPGPHGNGDLGEEAYRFADFLAGAGQRWWQMLPIHPVGEGNSPYGALSAIAGSPLLIGLSHLVEDGWLRADEVRPSRSLRADRVDYAAARRYRRHRLRKAFERFEAAPPNTLAEAFAAFRHDQGPWLEDYALFMALKQAHRGAHWTRWPTDLRDRQPQALARARREMAAEVRYHAFLQFLFDRQWQALRGYCASRGIGLIGDLPIFVAHDSADVWAHRELFHLDARGLPTVVAGVPPDYFSSDGQRWGNPLYRWDVLRARGYDWWNERILGLLRRHEVVRLDHFIGFQQYWEVPATARTAKTGRFRPGPRDSFFRHLQRTLGPLPFIAEDLGLVTEEVIALRDRFSLPGMRVLQFAFGSGPGANPHLPHNCTAASVVYTGTHDNDTVAGWYHGLAQAARRGDRNARTEQQYLLDYAAAQPDEVPWALIRLALQTVAHTAVIPVQDLLALGTEARMNRPGQARGNWGWRMAPDALTKALAERLGHLTRLYGRATTAEATQPDQRP